jgi:hypothetical protein
MLPGVNKQRLIAVAPAAASIQAPTATTAAQKKKQNKTLLFTT